MPRKKRTRYLKTIDIAREVGVHPNTVRLYEEWGFLQPVPRNPRNNYRLYTEAHLDQMRLAWAALHSDWWHSAKSIMVEMVKQAANDDLGGALETAYRYLFTVRAEYVRAEAAIAYLERWAKGQPAQTTQKPIWIGEAAKLLGLTRDMLRNWEVNGLIRVPRDPQNGYRLYGADEIGRLRVLRMLREAGYSMMAILRMVRALDRGQTENLREVLNTPQENEDIFWAADAWLTSLKACEERAEVVIAMLEDMIAKR
jgi:DNA-binding transcriptional MerR regulator